MGQRANYERLVQSDIHADPNAPQEHLDEIDADWAEAPIRRTYAPQLFPRNVQGSRRLKRTVQTTIWERRHGTSRASNAGLTLYRNYNLAYTCKYWWEALEFPGLARGTQWLAKIRVGGFWLAAPALNHIGTLESHWESHCPCCGNETPETLTYLGLQCPRWKQERSELLEGQQQLGITMIAEGRTLTLTAALATDGPLTEPRAHEWPTNSHATFQAEGPADRMRTRAQCALCADLLWWVSSTNPHCQPTTTHSMHDHERERRLPRYILTAKFLQRVVQRRQACIRRLSEHTLTTRPDSTSGEAHLEPTPPGV
jgi:hypothetical protein